MSVNKINILLFENKMGSCNTGAHFIYSKKLKYNATFLFLNLSKMLLRYVIR